MPCICRQFTEVYPRWRGEHVGTNWVRHDDSGLSPLARGTLPRFGANNRPRRFIPAGAGNTIMRWLVRRSISVYPRWRGEHAISDAINACAAGLSPLARGTQPQQLPQLPRARFIPAGAGNTSGSTRTRSGSPVYPRWRGEHPRTLRTEPLTGGLSPLARGTPVYQVFAHKVFRFIPAGAGNTLIWLTDSIEISVYPRWRGEHANDVSHLTAADGLSPLARGTRISVNINDPKLRFIPAGAGNTMR